MRTFRSNVLDALGWIFMVITFFCIILQISQNLSDSPAIVYQLIFTGIFSFLVAMFLWAHAKTLRNQSLIIHLLNEQSKSLSHTSETNESKKELVETKISEEGMEYRAKMDTIHAYKTVENILEKINSIQPGYELKHNKSYIGLIFQSETVRNFTIFKFKKSSFYMQVTAPYDVQMEKNLTDVGVNSITYDFKNGIYVLDLDPKNFTAYENAIGQLLSVAMQRYM